MGKRLKTTKVPTVGRPNPSCNLGKLSFNLETAVAHTIEVKFDHMKDAVSVKKVKSKFLVMKQLYVSREQFPLVLAYAITIH